MMTPFIEDFSRHAVLVFYAVAFGAALNAHWKTDLWARRISSFAIMTASLTWLYFYLFLANTDLSTAPRLVLYSRIAHYVTATCLFIMAYLIRRADKYGISVILVRENHE